MFISPFFGPPRFLTDEDVLRSISTMPSEIVDILELYDVNVIEHVSYSSGLIQTVPLLQNYDFTESDRKILIDYAVSKTEEIAKKEKECFEHFKKLIDDGDFYFMEVYKMFEFRVKYREEENSESIRKFLEETKYKK